MLYNRFYIKTVTVFLCILLIACADKKKVVIPSTVLSQEQMAKVMADLQLLEASINLNISDKVNLVTTPDIKPTILEIFKRHNISKKQYEDSFSFYTQHPDLFAEAYKILLNQLSELQAKVTAQNDSSDSVPHKP